MSVSTPGLTIEKHLPRTLYLADLMNLKIKVSDKLEINENEQRVFKHFTHYFLNLVDSKIEKDEAKILKEILAIETKKHQLKGSTEEIKDISKFEDELNRSRDQLLCNNDQTFLETRLVVSPYIYTYESHYRWILEENDLSKFDIAQNLNAPSGDFYFLFQKIGSCDALINSNIFEFPLNQYQYLLLQLFDESLTVEEAIDEFMERFVIHTSNEEQQLKTLTTGIIKNLLFRKFIFSNPRINN